MKIIIAPNSFKNSLDAFQVARAIETGLLKSRLPVVCQLFPIADGGDATVDVLNEWFDGEKQYVNVRDPLGRIKESYWSLVSSGSTAVIEMAKASGLDLITRDERDPFRTTTYGTGQLILDAVDKGVKEIMIGLGGSATVDAGLGIIQALGGKILDHDGKPLPEDRNPLMGMCGIDLLGVHPAMKEVKITILSDVTNPLLGEEGAAAVFGPQKGADEDGVNRLEGLLTNFNEVITGHTGKDYSLMAGGGAAGGIAVTLKAFFNAQIVSGIDYLLDKMGFEAALGDADLIITAEGRVDRQTLLGKGPMGVIEKAKKHHIPSIMLAGQMLDLELLSQVIDALFPITNGPVTLDEALHSTAVDLENTACQIGNLLHAISAG